MDFKEVYKKYVDGTANDEEKAFVEAEMERARKVNTEIISSSQKTNVETKKDNRRKKLKQTLKIIIVSTVVFLVISIIAFGTIFGLAVSNALDNIEVQPGEAKEKALEFSYIYARDHYGYTGSMEALNLDNHDPDMRELVFRVPFKKCHYVYDFEFLAGNMEFEVQVNSKTGMCTITDIDRID